MTEESEERIEQRADALAEDHEHLLQSLIAFRTTHGLTQAEVARRMGVSQPTVAQLEHYDANPTLSTIRRWALAVEARIKTEVIDDCVDSDATWSAIVSGIELNPEPIPTTLITASFDNAPATLVR